MIETDRLRLRPWGLGDVDDVLAYAQDPEWSRFVRALPQPCGRQHAEQFIIQARADDRNTSSQRVMAKLGMKKEGVLRKARIERGEAFDEAWFAILRSEWRS